MTPQRPSTILLNMLGGVFAVGAVLGIGIWVFLAPTRPASDLRPPLPDQPPAAPTAPGPSSAPPAPPRKVDVARCPQGCREDFEQLRFLDPLTWTHDEPSASARDLPPDALAFADDGEYFRTGHPSFAPPAAWRLSARFGPAGTFRLDAYSRTQKDPSQLCTVVEDPARPGNHVLRLASPAHTDGVIVATDNSLGERYQMCARVGYMDFGTGDGLNGYHGDEENEPWRSGDGRAVTENGFYFGAIVRSPPRPHNNVLAHYTRIAFMDSDNNTESWTQIWTGRLGFFRSGWNPVMLGVVDGAGAALGADGMPFASYAGEQWNKPGEPLAADAYLEHRWYTACFTRAGARLTLRISGEFRYGGQRTYEATVPAEMTIFGLADPNYWFAGDPHINYYEGSLLLDDLSLTTGTPAP